MKKLSSSFALFLFFGCVIGNAANIPFSGKLSDNGKNFHGVARFDFQIIDEQNNTQWVHDNDPGATLAVQVINGRYSVILGGQGMNPLPTDLFLNHKSLFLQVSVDMQDGRGLRLLSLPHRISSVPHSLTADLAQFARRAGVADKVSPGAVTADMLSSSIRADLNRTITPQMIQSSSITTAQLNEQILKYLRPEISVDPNIQGVAVEGEAITLQSRAEGKYLSYQWYKNGQPIPGATRERYVIKQVNQSQHDGNYSLVVSNEIGSAESGFVRVDAGKHRLDLNETVAMDMIWCPPGTFTMGSPTSEVGRTVVENQHQVILTYGFYLGKYEVTQAQYEAVMRGNSVGLNADPSDFKGSNRPVEKVSWEDAQVFLSRLNQIEQTAGRLPSGWKYVLPTEAQWEYACRAGTTTAFSWGYDINSSNANYNWDGAPNDGNDFRQTRDVGMYDPNPWGFFDMHGNVHEWVYDWRKWLPSSSQIDPEGPPFSSIDYKVAKGGSYWALGVDLRCANRPGFYPDSRRANDHGFRIAFQKVLPDTANPELVIFGGAAISRQAGQAWAEPGVEAHDARDGNITEQIVVTGTMDMNTTGTYTLNYAVQDAAGNGATATRTVTVTGTHTVDLNASVTMDMIWCPPGAFAMGSPANETGRGTNETQHNVLLNRGFYLGKHEVTQAQYEAVMTGVTGDRNATPSHWHGNPDRPVEKVSWEDAEVFLSRLNQQQAGSLPAGWSYVLPTEAQWEYACRAGTTTKYSWGNAISSTDANWDHGNDANQTQNVGSYNANPWGFFDMHGNVWEWVADWYDENYPSGNRVIDPKGPLSGSNRVVRGGSLSVSGTTLRSANRGMNPPTSRYAPLGFRIGFQKQL